MESTTKDYNKTSNVLKIKLELIWKLKSSNIKAKIKIYF